MSNLSWDYIQKTSDEILADGLYKLKSQPSQDFLTVLNKGFGNYLISLAMTPYYIGEAKDISKRIKQQFEPKTSTFYKTYLKSNRINQQTIDTDIANFKVQHISTNFGRKEIEEFGIVNLSTILNKFQLGKRNKFPISDKKGKWENVQSNSIDILKQAEIHILNNKFVSWFDLELLSHAGLYIVKDNTDRFIYIGESSDTSERIKTHSSKTYFSALRRHIGTEILGFQLQVISGKKRYFSDSEDKRITDYLKNCKVMTSPVTIGRYEVEEYLIKKYRPFLNRKDNKD